MKKRVYMVVFIVIITLIMGIRYIIYQDSAIPKEKLTSDIENQIIRTLKENNQNYSVETNAKIELYEDIQNKRFILYSFYNPIVGYRHCGYAIYEIKDNNKFKRMDFGWDSSSFSTKDLFTDNKEYLIVYGMNEYNEKQIYKFTCDNKEKVEVFEGDFFLKKYPLNGNIVSFTVK